MGQWEVGAFRKTNFCLEGNNRIITETNRYLNQNDIKQRTHRKEKQQLIKILRESQPVSLAVKVEIPKTQRPGPCPTHSPWQKESGKTISSPHVLVFSQENSRTLYRLPQNQQANEDLKELGACQRVKRLIKGQFSKSYDTGKSEMGYRREKRKNSIF